jgi:hypothetical protein
MANRIGNYVNTLETFNTAFDKLDKADGKADKHVQLATLQEIVKTGAAGGVLVGEEIREAAKDILMNLKSDLRLKGDGKVDKADAREALSDARKAEVKEFVDEEGYTDDELASWLKKNFPRIDNIQGGKPNDKATVGNFRAMVADYLAGDPTVSFRDWYMSDAVQSRFQELAHGNTLTKQEVDDFAAENPE